MPGEVPILTRALVQLNPQTGENMFRKLATICCITLTFLASAEADVISQNKHLRRRPGAQRLFRFLGGRRWEHRCIWGSG